MWLQGTKLDGYCLFGVSTVWIGRFAKVASFLAAMTIIIDIMGEDKVHAVGKALNQVAASRRKGLLGFASNAMDIIDRTGMTSEEIPGDSYMFLVSVTLSGALTAWIVWLVWFNFDIGFGWLFLGPVLFVMLVIFTPAFFFLQLLLIAVAGYIVGLVERVLSHEDLCRRLRIWAALIFVVSFLIDLFMS